MITLHHDKSHGENAYHYKLGNHLGIVFFAEKKSDFYDELIKFKEDFKESFYPKTDEEITVSERTLEFIERYNYA